jgi:hypothetical protein
MDSSRPLRGAYRRTRRVSATGLAVVALVAVVLVALERVASPAAQALAAIALPLAVTTGIVILAGVMLVVSPVSPVLPAQRGEAPLLARPRLPATRHDAPFLVVVGVAPKCGASTLAVNLALLVATEGRPSGGRAHRPRPLCLTAGSAAPDRLELDSNALDTYLAGHPTAARDDVVESMVRHASGAEFLACGESQPNAFQLRQMLPVLRRYYQCIVLDAWRDDQWTTDAAIDLADAVLLVSAGHDTAALSRWAERIWLRGGEDKTILVVNRRRAFEARPPTFGFQYTLELPEEPPRTSDELAMRAWGRLSAAGRQLGTAARLLLPALFLEGGGA